MKNIITIYMNCVLEKDGIISVDLVDDGNEEQYRIWKENFSVQKADFGYTCWIVQDIEKGFNFQIDNFDFIEIKLKDGTSIIKDNIGFIGIEYEIEAEDIQYIKLIQDDIKDDFILIKPYKY